MGEPLRWLSDAGVNETHRFEYASGDQSVRLLRFRSRLSTSATLRPEVTDEAPGEYLSVLLDTWVFFLSYEDRLVG